MNGSHFCQASSMPLICYHRLECLQLCQKLLVDFQSGFRFLPERSGQICWISGSAPIKHASFALIFHMIISNSHGKAQLSIRRLKGFRSVQHRKLKSGRESLFLFAFQAFTGIPNYDSKPGVAMK